MRRNLILLLDGTSNEVKDNLTNVVKLYRCAERSDHQRVFYHPGIGTVPLTTDGSPVAQSEIATFGLATGWGLDANILAAYRYLIDIYEPDQSFTPDQFDDAEGVQDQQTVWFAGDHSDVGVGWVESGSQIAKFPLIWMAREAQKHGLELNEALFDHLAEGAPLPGGKRMYVAPDAKGPIHNSMTAIWWPFEYLPKNRKWKRFLENATSGGYYLPRAEPRKFPEGALLHHSVIERMAMGYEPVNLPSDFMPVPPDRETSVPDENGQ